MEKYKDCIVISPLGIVLFVQCGMLFRDLRAFFRSGRSEVRPSAGSLSLASVIMNRYS